MAKVNVQSKPASIGTWSIPLAKTGEARGAVTVTDMLATLGDDSETLYDGLAGSGFTIRANSTTWSTTERIAFNRAISALDDGSDIRIFGSYQNGNVTKYIDIEMDAELFRLMEGITGLVNNAGDTVSFHIQRPTASATTPPSLSGWSEALMHVARWRDADGNDGLWFNVGSSGAATDLTAVKLKVVIVPAGRAPSPIEDLPVAMIGPGVDPTEENWENRAAAWTGERWNRIKRALVGTHGVVAHFATIAASDGREIIEEVGGSAADYATMRAARDGANKTVSALWADATDILAGDIVHTVAGGTKYIALSAHTTDNAVNNPGSTTLGVTLWLTYDRFAVKNHSSYRGVYGSRDEALASGNFTSSGSWFVNTNGGNASALRRHISPDGWSPNSLLPASLHTTIFDTNVEAHSEVRSYNSAEPEYYVIDGYLKVLRYYKAPAEGTALFTAEPPDEQYANVLLNLALGTPTADKVGQARFYQGQIYQVAPRWGIPPTVTWEYFTTADEIGELWGLSAADYILASVGARPVTANDGDVVAYETGRFEIYRTTVNPIGYRHLDHPQDWRGRFDDEATADHHTKAIGDTAIVDGALGWVTAWSAGSLPDFVWMPMLGAGPATAPAQTDGVSYAGPNYFSYRVYLQSATTPAASGYPSVSAGGALDLGAWFRDRQAAVDDYTGNATDTRWITDGSAQRPSADGDWTDNPVNVFPEWDHGFSAVGPPDDVESDWHVGLEDGDTWSRARDVNGFYRHFPLRNRDPNIPIFLTAATVQVRLESTTDTVDLTLLNAIADIDAYDYLGLEVIADNSHLTSSGPRYPSDLIPRPPGGWPVNNSGQRFWMIYKADTGCRFVFRETKFRDILNSGSIGAGNIRITNEIGLLDSARTADVQGGAVTAVRVFYLGGIFGYAYVRLVGVIL